MRARKWSVAAAALVLVVFLSAGSAVASSPVENGDTSIAYGGWVSVNSPSSLAGHVRESSVKNDTASYSFRGTSFGWYTQYGPNAGEAKVTLDGTQTWTVDLYAPTEALQPVLFNGFAKGHHQVVIKVLATHTAASTGNLVVVNGFSVNNQAPVSADSPNIVYDQWRTTGSVAASGGSYQSTAKKRASVSLSFSGVGVTWVTATGPGDGLAAVTIDGVDQGTADLYAAAAASQVDETYSGLTNGTHTITITALGSHDSSATGNTIVLDALIAIPQPTLTSITVTPGNGTVRQDQTLQYTATGTYSDGSQQDLTDQVTWSTSDDLNVNISNTAGSQGLLSTSNTTHGAAGINITATLGSVSGTTSVQVLCRLHQNGLGGTYADCRPLGTPGNAATYTEQMAIEAAESWGHGYAEDGWQCGTVAPYQLLIAVVNTAGPSASWSYTSLPSQGLYAGYVSYDNSGSDLQCPITGGASWN